MPSSKYDAEPRAPRLLRLRDVIALTGLSKSSVYVAMTQRAFPRPVALGARAVGWRESDVAAWIESRPPVPAARPVAQRATEART